MTKRPKTTDARVIHSIQHNPSPFSIPVPQNLTLNRPVNANANDDDVSPIDETLDMSRLNFGGPSSRPGSSSKPTSSIPVLRREKRRNQVAAAAANLVARKEVGDSSRGRPTQDPRWDPYSGEITTSDRGKPQSVKPGEYTPPALRTVNKPTGAILGNEADVSAGPKAHASFGDRVRKLKNNNAPTEKPGWKGASGRVTLVTPVADQPDIKPLSIPRKSSKRVASPHSGSPVSVIRRDETSPLTSHPPEQVDHTIRAVLSNSGRSTPRTDSPISVIHDPIALPQSASVKTQARGHLNPREVPNTQYQREESSGNIERNFREALADSFPENKDPYEQPPSRFSVTTYAPSEAQTTPRPSTDDWERPPMPTQPQPVVQQPSPILNRRRPKVVGDGPTSVSRKAIPQTSPVFISMTSSVSHKRQSTLSTLSKNLPQSPAEASSHDLITALQAQIDNLQHRRNNIAKSIRQMTELMPQDNLVITQEVRRKREDEKRKVEGLREEEADIRREEHELGLRLHRAYKRKDKEAVYEPTGLWVRRVTG
jgi:hypothetical protein